MERGWDGEKGFGLPMLPKNRAGKISEGLKRTMKKGLGCFMVSQEWGGNGLGKLKMKHEGFGCFSWFPRIVYENEA